VIDFFDERFAIGFNEQEKADLLALLQTLQHASTCRILAADSLRNDRHRPVAV
jgi:hypothetical protein